MKKLVIISEDSIFAGCDKSGMAEIVDSFANSLNDIYDVTVICPDQNGIGVKAMIGRMRSVMNGVRSCRFVSVDYYLVKPEVWSHMAVKVAEQLGPDVIHIFSNPRLALEVTKRPKKLICTLGSASDARRCKDCLKLYDAVTVHSDNLAREILKLDDMADIMSEINFVTIPAGVLTPFFDPSKGIMLAAKYSTDNLNGKRKCKDSLRRMYSIVGNPCIYLMASRLIPSEGLEMVIGAAETLRDTGGVLIVLGKVQEEYERILFDNRSNGIIYVPRMPSPLQIMPMAAGADFYLSPSETDSYGLYPMTASRYGAIPIVTQHGGHADNFNDNTSIIIDENGLSDAIIRASELYADKDAFTEKRKICMEADYSWATRREKYVELYEN
jgi:glycosyltransferase involved in cell wall biosynthesis